MNQVDTNAILLIVIIVSIIGGVWIVVKAINSNEIDIDVNVLKIKIKKKRNK